MERERELGGPSPLRGPPGSPPGSQAERKKAGQASFHERIAHFLFLPFYYRKFQPHKTEERMVR